MIHAAMQAPWPARGVDTRVRLPCKLGDGVGIHEVHRLEDGKIERAEDYSLLNAALQIMPHEVAGLRVQHAEDKVFESAVWHRSC